MGNGNSTDKSGGAAGGTGAGGGGKNKNVSQFQYQVCTDHKGSVNCMALSDDGSVLVTGSDDCTARIWSTTTDSVECLGVLEGHEKYINCIGIEDNFIVTGSADKTIRKWDISTCKCVDVYEGNICDRNGQIDYKFYA